MRNPDRMRKKVSGGGGVYGTRGRTVRLANLAHRYAVAGPRRQRYRDPRIVTGTPRSANRKAGGHGRAGGKGIERGRAQEIAPHARLYLVETARRGFDPLRSDALRHA